MFGLHRIVDELEEGRSSIAKSAHERELMEKSLDEIARSRMTLKGEIERALMERYKISITIVL